MSKLHVVTARDLIVAPRGTLTAYERPAGRTDLPWKKVLTAKNIVLNAFYNDLFNIMNAGASPASLVIGALALGISNVAVARTDTGLGNEWSGVNIGKLASQLNSGTPYTAIPLATPLPVALVSTNALTIGAISPTVSAAGAAQGVTSIPVNSVTPGSNILTGTAVSFAGLSVTAQRMSPTATTPTITDPPSNIWSFYLPAGANAVAFQFQEAGLLYNAPSLTPGGTGSWATHALFAYNKPVNTDVRIDYTLQRTLT